MLHYGSEKATLTETVQSNSKHFQPHSVRTRICWSSKQGEKQGTKVKVNFDKQIVAIAIANGVRHIYSDDKGIASFAAEVDINVVTTWDLPAPKMM